MKKNNKNTVNSSKVTVVTLWKMKKAGEKIAVATAYDYPMARALDEAGMDVALVGDSLGNVVLGYDSTLLVTLEDMIHHAKAVCRGVERALVVVDLPFMSYQISPQQALMSAGRVLKETGAQAVKLEGGEEMASTVRFLRSRGIAVMGHVGLTPQSVHALGGFRIQGRDQAGAAKLIRGAKALEKAGAFSVVLEAVPAALARKVTKALRIPTIGIGAGLACDGQVLVAHDLLGMNPGSSPRFAKAYAGLYKNMRAAFGQYKNEVKSGRFPGKEQVIA
jgi:3-methyl-2-oxobutanoate hydroxymethyltransferase